MQEPFHSWDLSMLVGLRQPRSGITVAMPDGTSRDLAPRRTGAVATGGRVLLMVKPISPLTMSDCYFDIFAILAYKPPAANTLEEVQGIGRANVQAVVASEEDFGGAVRNAAERLRAIGSGRKVNIPENAKVRDRAQGKWLE
jgi:hypothetical protein